MKNSWSVPYRKVDGVYWLHRDGVKTEYYAVRGTGVGSSCFRWYVQKHGCAVLFRGNGYKSLHEIGKQYTGYSWLIEAKMILDDDERISCIGEQTHTTGAMT